MASYDYTKLLIVQVMQHHPNLPATAILAKCEVCGKHFSVNGERKDSAITTIKNKWKKHSKPGTNQECYAGARTGPAPSYHKDRSSYYGSRGPSPRRISSVDTQMRT